MGPEWTAKVTRPYSAVHRPTTHHSRKRHTNSDVATNPRSVCPSSWKRKVCWQFQCGTQFEIDLLCIRSPRSWNQNETLRGKNVCQTLFYISGFLWICCDWMRRRGGGGAGSGRHSCTKTHRHSGKMHLLLLHNIKMHDHIHPLSMSCRPVMQYLWVTGFLLHTHTHTHVWSRGRAAVGDSSSLINAQQPFSQNHTCRIQIILIITNVDGVTT